MKFFQRPVFRVVGIIIVATVVGVLGLTSTVSDQAENEGDILSTSALSENGPLPSEEILKLNSLEKTFLDSDFYRKDGMLPLTVTKDQKYFVTYKLNKQSMAAENELILIGMPRQLIELYLVDLSENKAAFLGKTEFVINQAWSEDGARLALVSHKSVKVLDLAKRSLAEVPMKYETDIYNTSWGLDNRTIYLHLDTTPNYYAYDTYSKQMVKVRGGFQEGDVAYRGKADGGILTSKGERVGVASGLYYGEAAEKQLFAGDVIIHDINHEKILVSCDEDNPEGGARFTLAEYDLKTGASRVLYNEGNLHTVWKIFKASYLKTTGDIIFTTFKLSDTGVKYRLVRIEPKGKETVAEVPSPLYTLTPGENLLHFAAFVNGASCIMDTADFKFSDPGLQQAEQKSDIRDLMLRVLYLYGSESPKLEELKQVFINTYDPIPQEALENIVLETEGLKYWQFIRQEIGKNVTMTLKMKAPNRAEVILDGKYFRGPHELVEIDGKWYVTGLSTWPDSQARKDVYRACTKFIDTQIKTGQAEADFRQKGIQDDYAVRTAALLNKIRTQSSKIELGEIELWSMSEPHRAVNPDAKEARVKMIVTLNDGSTEKLQGYFSRADSGDTWIFQGLGKLSPGLFPQTY
ncbi:hypothetical protein [Desulfosporosinus meridiei]|uniref:Uncharacterized protein n=1 Tax=Desulfosporosinus meridiei (strain ATCC BAA-275 / DSM 13257 / KCTC 12902 / NCIMB 13706 / S10) TaxID=768704 RepID=J7J214_DESMD|nr:hypothetical protein [Desulfosporosinus meridiei]AFQ45323.1 hypothetical protein Desmer_3476 [Desulfosporosinus meridiei DSM 13257]